MPNIVLHIQPAFQVPGYPACFSGTPFAIKVERILRYKGLSFTVQEVDWLERAAKLPALSKSGKLPVLDYDGQRIEDSTAIAYFIEERHPEPTLIPRDAFSRAQMHVVEDWADEVLYFYGIYGNVKIGGTTTIPYLLRKLPQELEAWFETAVRTFLEELLDRQGMGRYPTEKFRADLTRSLDSIDALIARQGFAADSVMTLADLALWGQLRRYFLSGTQPLLEHEVRGRKALVDWVARVDATSGGGR